MSLTTGGGLDVPNDLTLGRRVFCFSEENGKPLSGHIVSIGENVCQVRVDGESQDRTVSWPRIVTDATLIRR
jgi:hypothetical protein